MGKFLGGHILLVYSWIEVLFVPALKAGAVVTICTPQKIFKDNECSGERGRLKLGINYLDIQTVNLQLICRTARTGWYLTVVFFESVILMIGHI